MRWYDVAEWSNVEDMYKYAKQNSLKLLSDYPADFWIDYIANHEDYDKQFMRMYKSYRYYMQNPYDKDNETIADITDDFIEAVYMHLKMNNKKYTELYKINVLNDNTISPLDDYSMTEIMDRTIVNGAREDSNDETLGTKTDTITSQIEGFNSSDFDDSNRTTNVYGQQLNGNTFNKGEQENTDDYTLTKKGSMNNPYENINKFKSVWNNYEFMNYIFKNICADLLLV